MRKISSRTTFIAKRVFPVVWFGFLAFIVLAPLAIMKTKREFRPEFLVVPVIMAVMGYFVMKKLVFDLVDDVWDDGDSLVVRNNGKDERILLANIINVGYAGFTNPQRVTLTLREPCAFGKEVTFSPPSRWFSFSTHPVVSELIERIDQRRKTPPVSEFVTSR